MKQNSLFSAMWSLLNATTSCTTLSGSQMRSRTLLTMLLTVMAMTAWQQAWAQPGPYSSTIEVDGVTYPRFMEFDAYAGTGTEYTYENNHYYYLVDGGWTTWAVEYAYAVEPFIEFDTKKPIIPKGYILSTSFYAAQHPNRNPKGWVLKGKRFPGDEWTTIDEQTNYELPAEDHKDVVFKKPGNTNVYQYFRLDISKNFQSEDVVAYGHVVGIAYITELCELQFYGSEYDTTHDLYYGQFENLRRYYPRNAVNLNYTVRNSAGTTLTKGTDYTETIRNSSNQEVTEITEVGTYTLTVTGINNYSGTLSSSFVVYEKLAGSGSKTDPYIIGDAAQWQVFATSLNEGKNYMANYIKLADDFDNSDEPITLMASASDNQDYWFYGHFDGNGRTLHINLTGADQDYCGPFRQTINADIHDLNVAGTITMSNGQRHAGSIVGCVNSGGTITNCHSTVTIYDNTSHDGRHGGMVGLTQNNGTLTFTNCSFQGKIMGNGYSCGGFVGWNSDGCAISYNNCFFKPSELGNNVKSNSATFNCSNNGEGAGTSTFNDAYFLTDMNLGLVQGLEVSDTHPTVGMYKKVIAVDGNTYYSDNVNTTLYTQERYRLTNGGDVQPLIVVKHGNSVLTEGTDFTIDYSHVKSTVAHTYPIIITGTGSYAGSAMKELTISDTYGMTVCENTDESEYVPFRGMDLTDYQKTEFVIPASQLTAMNGQTIKELKFYITSSGHDWNNTFTVFMKEVDFTTFDSQSPSFSGTADATEVFVGQPSVNNHTVTFSFANSDDYYQYKGGNLLIGCYVEKRDSWSNLSFYGKNVTGACIHGRNTDSMDAVSATQHDFLPTVSFGYALVDLANDTDNTSVISNNTGAGKNVILSGRTLFKDGKWNTLCLPFNVTIADSPLAGAEARELSSASISNGVLNLNFSGPVSELAAGTPYIIKWASSSNTVNPVFFGTTISTESNNFTNNDGDVSFKGTYIYTEFKKEEKNILFLDDGNMLYYPLPSASIGACHAYFQLGDASNVRSFVLNFGDNKEAGITNPTASEGSGSTWHSLDGRKLAGQPTTKGLYIYNGKKMVVK